MSPHAHREKDPLAWCVLLALAFVTLAWVRLAIPSTEYFDEIHYLPAARALLDLSEWRNQEHPMLGKELLAAGIWLFGDTSFGWRILPLLAGGGTLFALMRATWFATWSRFATLTSGLLLATGFILFILSRIAMLDIFMLFFAALAIWQLAGAVRQPERGRGRLALAGVALGCAMGAKWNVLPIVPLPGLAFLAWRIRAGGWRFAFTHRGAPVPGVTLAEAALWLGLVPLVVYALTFTPALYIHGSNLGDVGLIEHHRYMFKLQESVTKPHAYMSTWRNWIVDERPIWFLYHETDGAQRGILMLGNPFSMLLGLPALLWCLWAGLFRKRRDALAVFILYAVSFGFWIVAEKPVQFYYHYALPSMFLLIALALALDAAWRAGWRKITLAVLAINCAVFVWFYPIISAAPLAGPQSFNHWMLVKSWR